MENGPFKKVPWVEVDLPARFVSLPDRSIDGRNPAPPEMYKSCK